MIPQEFVRSVRELHALDPQYARVFVDMVGKSSQPKPPTKEASSSTTAIMDFTAMNAVLDRNPLPEGVSIRRTDDVADIFIEDNPDEPNYGWQFGARWTSKHGHPRGGKFGRANNPNYLPEKIRQAQGDATPDDVVHYDDEEGFPERISDTGGLIPLIDMIGESNG